MLEVAAFGWVALVWWTWPALFVVTMAAVWTGVKLGERRAQPEVRPCLEHMGTAGGSEPFEMWCMRRSGHDGSHVDQWGLTDEDPDETWESEHGE